MRTKEEILERISAIDSEIDVLKEERSANITLLKGFPMNKSEQLHNVIMYGTEDSYIIDYTNGGLIEEYFGNCSRHETIDVDTMIEGIMSGNYCETWEEHLEILNIIGGYTMKKEDYEKYKGKTYSKVRPKQMFIDMIDDVIEGDAKEFEFDW